MPTAEEVRAANLRAWGYSSLGLQLEAHDELRRRREFRRARAALQRAGLVAYPSLTPEELADLDTLAARIDADCAARVAVTPSWRARYHTRRRPRRVRNGRLVGPMEAV